MGGESQLVALQVDEDDPDILYSPQSPVEVPGYAAHELMALFVVVVFTVGMSTVVGGAFDKDALWGSFSKGKSDALVVLGAAAYVPFDGKLLRLKNVKEADPDGNLGLELDLRQDDLCSLFSPHPVYVDSPPAVVTKGKKLAQTSASAVIDATGPKARKLTATSASGLRSSGQFNASGTSRKVGEGDVSGSDYTLRVGLDLQAVHKAMGKLEDGSDPEDWDVIDETMPERRDRDRDLDDVLEVGKAVGKTEKKSPFATSRRRQAGRREEDAESVVESLVGGDSDSSVLRLDPEYYGEGERVPEPSLSSRAVSEESDARLHIPRDRSSLLGRSLTTRLAAPAKYLEPDRDPSGLMEDEAPLYAHSGASVLIGPTGLTQRSMRMSWREQPEPMRAHVPVAEQKQPARVARTTVEHVPVRSVIAVTGASAYTRELSRAARAKLSRHGFTVALEDSVGSAAGDKGRPPHGKHPVVSNDVALLHAVVDTELEARDPLSLHDITFQFAGYRAGPPAVSEIQSQSQSHLEDFAAPRSVYFTFQFYSCPPLRTEIMRLLPSEKGELSVLARDDAKSRDETPLAVRFHIDCSLVSPTEAVEFAEYLARSTLFIEVWDADSLLLLGQLGVPVHRLLRQGRKAVKGALECDVVDAESGMVAEGGVTTSVVSDGGPVHGNVVGSVCLIMANYGQAGRGRAVAGEQKAGERQRSQRSDAEGLNWRALRVEESAGEHRAQGKSSRPRTSVRARPLAERYGHLIVWI